MSVKLDSVNSLSVKKATPSRAIQLDSVYSLSEGSNSLTGNSKWQSIGQAQLTAGIISAAGSLISGYYSAKTQKAQLEMQQRIAEYNQRRAEKAAQSALIASNQRIGQISEEYQSVKAHQKVSYGAGGVVVGVGSAAEVTASTDINMRRSIDNERINGYQEAWNYRMQAVGYGTQASLYGSASVNYFSGLGDATKSLGSGIRDYLYLNRKQS